MHPTRHGKEAAPAQRATSQKSMENPTTNLDLGSRSRTQQTTLTAHHPNSPTTQQPNSPTQAEVEPSSRTTLTPPAQQPSKTKNQTNSPSRSLGCVLGSRVVLSWQTTGTSFRRCERFIVLRSGRMVDNPPTLAEHAGLVASKGVSRKRGPKLSRSGWALNGCWCQNRFGIPFWLAIGMFTGDTRGGGRGGGAAPPGRADGFAGPRRRGLRGPRVPGAEPRHRRPGAPGEAGPGGPAGAADGGERRGVELLRVGWVGGPFLFFCPLLWVVHLPKMVALVLTHSQFFFLFASLLKWRGGTPF